MISDRDKLKDPYQREGETKKKFRPYYEREQQERERQ
jgi:hypothetical protein